MGKNALRLLSVFLIVGGLITVGLAGEIKEASKPQEIQMGIMVNGHVQETDRGYIGGNLEAESEMNALTGIGVLTIGLGVGSFVLSAVLSSEKNRDTTGEGEQS